MHCIEEIQDRPWCEPTDYIEIDQFAVRLHPREAEGSDGVTGSSPDCMGGFSLRLLVSATTESNAIQKTRQGHCIFLIRSKPRVSHCLVPSTVRSRSILDSVGAQRSDYKGIID